MTKFNRLMESIRVVFRDCSEVVFLLWTSPNIKGRSIITSDFYLMALPFHTFPLAGPFPIYPSGDCPEPNHRGVQRDAEIYPKFQAAQEFREGLGDPSRSPPLLLDI